MDPNKSNETNEETKEFNLDDLTTEENIQTEELEFKPVKKQNIFKRIIAKFKSLPKKYKVLIIIGIILFIALVTTLTIYFINKNKKDENPGVVVENVVVKDNYKYIDGVLYILDKEDNEIGTYTCNNKDETLCYIAYEMNDDNFNVPTSVFEDGTAIKKRSQVYEDKYVFIYDNKTEEDGVIVLYDLSDNKEVDSYLGIKSYKINNIELTFLKTKENKYQITEITSSGVTKKIDSEYDYAGTLSNSKDLNGIVVLEKNKYSIINLSGRYLVKNLDYSVKYFNLDYIVIADSKGNQYLMDHAKEFIFDKKFKFIELLDDYVITIDENNYLRVTDYEGNKMNEDNIKLTSTDYNKKYIFNADGVFSKEEGAYTYELNGDSFTFTIGDNTYQINTLEGKLSSKYNYINYFDGILYFYKDGQKLELIGSYECSNKNNILPSTTTLDKCTIAVDTNLDDSDMMTDVAINGIVPIYNDKYVFIRDAAALASNDELKIKLYEIDTKKIISSYVTVNSYSNAEEITIESLNNKLIIAKNKNSKFGAIKINSTSLASAINFEYEMLERLGNYYVGKSNGKWLLLDEAGNKMTSDLNEKIVGYKGSYLKTKNNSRYRVYNFDGTKAYNEDYKNVELYDSLYVGINDANKIMVYDYTGSEVINEYLSFSKSFDLDLNGTILTITIDGTANIKFDISTHERI